MNWLKYGEKWKNSVLQLRVTKAIYKPDRPYGDPNDEQCSGSGFIIDVSKGLVVTNAHVVSNAISISGRIPKLGKREMSIELIGICREKDIALCKIDHEDISLLLRGIENKEEQEKFNMVFGDNMEIKATDEVMTIGYPLGQENIKYTTGIISGFETNIIDDFSDVEDAIHRSPSYIQITAAINPGNSGGPLINNKGEVIGINAAGYLFAQNIGYAIPSRTFLAIYPELLKNTVVKIPTLALAWNKTNRELMNLKMGDEKAYGIYVREVYPDSCFDLSEGDIIRKLTYEDPFWGNKTNFLIDNIININYKSINQNQTEENKTDQNQTEENKTDQNKTDQNTEKTIFVSCYFDRFGDAMVGTKTEKGFLKLTPRKLCLAEIVDMIPIGSNICLEITRDGDGYQLMNTHSYFETSRIPRCYPRLNPVDFEIFAGLCCANIDMCHIETFDNLSLMTKDPKKRYLNRVVITQVFPGTSAHKSQVLKQGHLLDTINNKKVRTLEDVREILRTQPDEIHIKTKNKCYFIVKTKNIIQEDKRSMKNFNIRNHNYLLVDK